MKESKTVREWLEQAKAEGYTWADEALREHEARPLYDKGAKFSSIYRALLFGFDWRETPQGRDFWEMVWNEQFEKEYKQKSKK